MKLSQLKNFLLWLGRILMIAGLLFVVLKIWAFKEELVGSASVPWLWIFVMMFCILYGLAGIFLAYGWLSLLQAQGLKPFPFSWKEAWPLYGKTQIAKYIPGNIFHIAGRHALANQQGVSHSQLVVAATLEIFLVLLSAGIISLLAFSPIIRKIHNPFFIFTIFILAGLALVSITLLIHRSQGSVKIAEKLQWSKIIFALFSYLVFFLFSCCLFLLTLMIVSGETTVILASWHLIMGGYAFSWAVGFIFPGAPGGLGIREASLLALLSTPFPVPELLLGILAFRLITTLGDIVFFVVSVGFQKYYRKKLYNF